MPKTTQTSDDVTSLRSQAEIHWQERQAGVGAFRTNADAQRQLHELEVHQIELEIQNAEMKRSRCELEAAMKRISDLVDFAPMGYFSLDAEGAIRESNLAGACLLGVGRPSLVDRRFGLFVAPQDRRRFADYLQQVFLSKSQASCEVALLVEGKPPFTVKLDAVTTESGRTCKVALTDLTEHMRAEEEQLVLNKLESTGILAGGIAHDFNNLLTAIILSLDLARTFGPSDTDLPSCLDEAMKAALMARGLAQQLITFSKGGSPNRTATALPMVIQESVRPALSGSRVRCDFDLTGDLWPVLADKGQIGRVLCNLVLNAREAMPEGGVVSIRADNVIRRPPEMPALPPGEYVRVSITDRGVGISPEDLPRIFDPYFSTKQRGTQKGMGLGLTICHSIMAHHGGAITVKSVPGAGTTVDLYLPVAAQLVRDENASVPGDHPPHRRILVMDDEDAVRAVCGRTLRKMGHEVELVENGQAAVAAYRTAKTQGRPFDVVFLDLPIRDGMGGRETIEVLRQIEPCVKAIAMSGFTDDPIIEEYARHGFSGALAKPFDLEKLREVLA